MNKLHYSKILLFTTISILLFLLNSPILAQTIGNTTFGDGVDGDFSGGDPNSTRSALSGNASAGQPTISVINSSNFNINKEILVIQIQGSGAGNYEFGTIASKGPGYITLYQNLSKTYSQDGVSRAQVLQVPHYANVSGGISTGEWDGNTGGVVAFRAINISEATIDISIKGFKGGYGNGSPNNFCGIQQAQQGHSPSGPGSCDRYNNGGGGGGGTEGSSDPHFGSGGGGGYGLPGEDGVGNFSGYGGSLYGVNDLSLVFLGSGGGGGDWGTNPYGGGRNTIQGDDFAGQGAGAIFVFGQTIFHLNAYANGNNGGRSSGGFGGYGGGGGAGGSIRLVGGNITLGAISAVGGAGGEGTRGNGGNGGNGRIFIQYCSTLTGTTNPPASVQQLNCNTAPVAVNDNYNTNEDTALTVTIPGMLSNDTDTENNVLSAIKVSDPTHGTLTLNADGSFTYTPSANFNGADSFTYKANDGTADSNVATVTITVNAVNDAPSFTKGADQALLEDAGPQTVNNWATAISAGPVDELSQTVTFLVSNDNNALFSTQPVITPAGTLSFIPASNANGSATITVQLQDNGGTANTGQDISTLQTFVITVTPVNDAPSFTKGADQTVIEDAGAQSVAGWATGISSGPPNENSQALTFLVTNNTNPSLFSVGPAIAADGTLSFASAPNANGSATITMALQDNSGAANGGIDISSPQTFQITVTPVDDPPSAVNDTATVNEDAPATTINVLANDPDIDGGVKSIVSVTQPAHGAVIITNNGADLTYQSATNYCNNPPGTTLDSFTYTLTPGGSTATVAMTVTCVDDLPIAVSDTATVAEDMSATTIDVLVNDTDVDGGARSITSVTQPTNGTVVITNGGATLTYQPRANYCNNPPGTTLDTFAYTLNPGSSTASVIMTVTCVNDPPIAINDSATTRRNRTITIPVLTNDSDVDGDTLTITGVSSPSSQGGTVTTNGATVTYKPKNGFIGADSFTYTIGDGHGGTATATVNVAITR